MDRGEKFEKDATATPRQSGYLETARAMYEYAYYKDEELAHAVSVERSWDCSVACRRRWARFPFCRRPSICVSRARLWWVRGERVRSRWSTSFWELLRFFSGLLNMGLLFTSSGDKTSCA